jgi:hypothetical protein
MATPDVPTFPIRPQNRPSLPHIRYRLGAYPDILDAMLRQLNASAELERWTHRSDDDPGIALLESAAVVADILTFYQEHYANEAYLRTAQWRESIQELVRLTGYRLTPGIGGRATFAIELKGTDPVTVPAKFPIKADLANVSDPVDFLTTDDATAYPQFGKFRLYRKRYSDSGLTAHTTQLEIFAVDSSKDPADLDALALKKGDKLMLVAAKPAWIDSGTTVTDQQPAQIVKVSKVTPLLGRLIVDIEGEIAADWTGSVHAYRVNRVFRHFAHNTPVKTTYQTTDSGGKLTSAQTDAHLNRHIKYDPCQGSPDYLYTPLYKRYLPLDQEVNDLSVRAKIVVEALINPDGGSGTIERKVWLVRTIEGLSARTMSWGNVSGPSTWIDLGDGAELIPNSSWSSTTADIREFRVHEVTSGKISLRPPSYGDTGNLATNTELYYYGTKTDAEILIGRRVYFLAADGRFAFATVANVGTSSYTYARLREVTLDRVPAKLNREDFDEATPTTDVFGNLVDVTQGKAETVVPLGNGDARQVFQTFKLPKAPLTYLLHPEVTPPQVPELTIRVDGREWTQVDSFFGRGPREEIYIVRENAKADSYVQFGDGETGARLSSGIKNVTAEYRTGIFALGPGKPGSKPTAGKKIDHLDKLTLAGEVTEGAPAEDENKARLAAPGKLQSLGRLVSLSDYESETLQIGGVVTATAAWEIIAGAPTVHLCVLLEQAQQTDAQFSAVEDIIQAADASRGPNRYPIKVTQCELRYVYLSVTYACDPKLLAADVEAALKAALGLVGDDDAERTGLFGLRNRRLGEKEYRTRIEGVLQNVTGIQWCRVEHLGLLPAADDPTTLAVPATPQNAGQISCAATELLQLHPLHLSLTPATP